MKSFLFFSLLNYCLPLDSLPSQSQLFASIDSFYAAQAQAELLEFQESSKGEWLKYLPNVGLSYTVTGQPRPAITFSSGILYTALKDKKKRLAKTHSILEKYRLEGEKAKAKVLELILEYQLLQQELAFQQQVLEIDRELFAIHQFKYNRMELAPSEYLKLQKAFLLEEKKVLDLKAEERLLRTKILSQSYFIL